MPPVLLLRGELNRVHRHHDGLTTIALANNFNAVRGMFAGGKINDESFADPPPARLFATPLNAATGPGKLLAVVQAAAGANNAVCKVCAGTFEDVSRGPRMGRWVRRRIVWNSHGGL